MLNEAAGIVVMMPDASRGFLDRDSRVSSAPDLDCWSIKQLVYSLSQASVLDLVDDSQ